MARPKSEFLSAWGTMFEIIKALVDEVLSQGGNDESVRLILINKKVCQSMVKLLIDADKAIKQFLKFLGEISIPAITEKFVVNDNFKVDISKQAPIKISYIEENFKHWFSDKVEEPILSETSIYYHELLHRGVDNPIITTLGGEEKVETSLSQVHRLMKLQRNGETGKLLNNGNANIFYVRDVNQVLRAVGVCWFDGGWDVYARSIENPFWWSAGFQVFSSNYRFLDI